MKRTNYRRLFRLVMGRNPDRAMRRRVQVSELQRELVLEAVEGSKPMRFCGHVLVDGRIEPASLDSFIPVRKLAPQGLEVTKTSVVGIHD